MTSQKSGESSPLQAVMPDSIKAFESEKKTNLFSSTFTKPGLYQIFCLKTDKRYIGESSYCLSRLRNHLKDLINSTHHCQALQADFNKWGLHNFEATIIDSGDKWKEQKVRRQEETRLIETSDKDKIYNYRVEARKVAPYCKSYQYDEQVFYTIKALREYYNHKAFVEKSARPLSESTFRPHVINRLGPFRHLIILIGTTKQLKEYRINGKIFTGIDEIVKKGFARNKRQACYRLGSPNWPNYEYLNKTEIRKNRRKMSINDKIYITEQALAKGLAENRDQLYQRLRSQSKLWKTWYWLQE